MSCHGNAHGMARHSVAGRFSPRHSPCRTKELLPRPGLQSSPRKPPRDTKGLVRTNTAYGTPQQYPRINMTYMLRHTVHGHVHGYVRRKIHGIFRGSLHILPYHFIGWHRSYVGSVDRVGIRRLLRRARHKCAIRVGG